MIAQRISSLPIVDILKVGFSGFIFLMALLVFYLLRNEQSKKKPNLQLLQYITKFMKYIVVLGILVAVMSIIENITPPILKKKFDTKVINHCREELEGLLDYSKEDEITVQLLSNNVERTVKSCLNDLDKLKNKE